MTLINFYSILLILLVSFGAAGCGPRVAPSANRTPVKGELWVENQPAAGAVLKFIARESALPGEPKVGGAIVDSQGKFVVSTDDGHLGLPPNEYDVWCVWMSDSLPGGNTVDRLRGHGVEANGPRWQISVGETPLDLGRLRVNH